MVGGSSIIFHPYHEKDKTRIRETEMQEKGLEPKISQKIVGYDANALYFWALMQDAPTGPFTRRREESSFKKESSIRMADEWLAWEAKQRGIAVRHRLNDTEKRIGDRQLPVDGFHAQSRTVFQFQGMNTNKAYIAIAGESVDSLVKPELRQEYEQDKANWFPRTDTLEHRAYDKRTPGLLKEEWSGDGIIGLATTNLVVKG